MYSNSILADQQQNQVKYLKNLANIVHHIITLLTARKLRQFFSTTT